MTSSDKGLLSFMKRNKRKLAMACLLGTCPALAGCYGKFPLTKAVYRMNGSVENNVVRQVVFWVFVIIPIYGGASFIDAIVFNLVEFWTSEDIDLEVQTLPDGRTVEMTPSEDGSSVLMTVSRDGEVVDTMRFVRLDDGRIEARSVDGEAMGMLNVKDDGSVQLLDDAGEVVYTVEAGA